MTTRRLFQHPILGIDGFPVQTRTGTAEYIRLRAPDWVNVVPITAEGEVVLVRQHRWGIDEETLEIPGGVVDPGEAPVAAALRELREETGFGGGQAEALGWVWSNPAIQDNRTWLYVARDVKRLGPPAQDDGEDIRVELHPLQDVPRLLSDGTIRHALAVVSLQRLLLRS